MLAVGDGTAPVSFFVMWLSTASHDF